MYDQGTRHNSSVNQGEHHDSGKHSEGQGPRRIPTRPHHTLLEAVNLLAEKRVGAAVATDDDMKVLGILSERDIIRAISAGGRDALDSPTRST